MRRIGFTLALVLAANFCTPSPTAQAQLTAEPTADEVRSILKSIESKNGDAFAKGLALIKLASFGPKSSAAAGDAMAFLMTADITEASAIPAIAQRIVATDANARKLALVELKRGHKLTPERRALLAEGISKGSIEVSSQLLAETAWTEAFLTALTEGRHQAPFADADQAALKPRVPLLIKLVQGSRPPRGEATTAQLQQARRALQLVAQLGSAGAAATDVLKKIAADPKHPLQPDAARALGTGGLAEEIPETLVAMLKVDATSQQATAELTRRPLQAIAAALTVSLGAIDTNPVAADYFAQRINEERAKVKPTTPRPTTRPVLFAIDPTLAVVAKNTVPAMRQKLIQLDPTRGSGGAEKLAIAAGLFAADVPEMREFLVELATFPNNRAGAQQAMLELGAIGEPGLAELQKLTTHPDQQVASLASGVLTNFPVADPVSFAKQLLTESNPDTVQRGFSRLQMSPDTPPDAWLTLLDLKSFELAYKAAERLRAAADTDDYAMKAMPALVKRLSDPDVVKARLAAASLSGDRPAAVAPLVDLLKRVGHASPEPIEALLRMGDAGPKALIHLAITLKTTDLQPYVAGSLEALKPEVVKQNLADIETLAASDRKDTVQTAIKLLANARPESAASLQRLASSKSDMTRAALTDVLSPDDPSEAATLETLCADVSTDVSERAMQRLCTADAGRAMVMKRLSATVGAQRKAALNVLARSRGNNAASELNAFAALTNDPDAEVRRALYLAAWDNTALASRIAFTGISDGDEICRKNAAQAVRYVRAISSADDLFRAADVRDRDATIRDELQVAINSLRQTVIGNAMTLDPTVVPDLIKATTSANVIRRRHAAQWLGTLVTQQTPDAVAKAKTALTALSADADAGVKEAAAASLQAISNPY